MRYRIKIRGAIFFVIYFLPIVIPIVIPSFRIEESASPICCKSVVSEDGNR